MVRLPTCRTRIHLPHHPPSPRPGPSLEAACPLTDGETAAHSHQTDPCQALHPVYCPLPRPSGLHLAAPWSWAWGGALPRGGVCGPIPLRCPRCRHILLAVPAPGTFLAYSRCSVSAGCHKLSKGLWGTQLACSRGGGRGGQWGEQPLLRHRPATCWALAGQREPHPAWLPRGWIHLAATPLTSTGPSDLCILTPGSLLL